MSSSARDEFGRVRNDGRSHGDNGRDRNEPRGRYDDRHRGGDERNDRYYRESRDDHRRGNDRHDRHHRYEDDHRRHDERSNGDGHHYGPAHGMEDDISPGMVVNGVVTRIETYGAFLDFDAKGERLRGLIHISQLAPHRVEQVSDVLRLQQNVHAVILEVEQQRGRQRRIRLGLKDVNQETGKFVGANLQQTRGEQPPPRELHRRAKQRRDMYLDFSVDWKNGSKEWETSRAPGYLRALWSASPEPPSAAPAKKTAPPPPSDSEDSGSSSDSSESSISARERRRRRRKRERGRKSRRRSRHSRKRRRRYSSSSESSSEESSSDTSKSSSSSASSAKSSSAPQDNGPQDVETAHRDEPKTEKAMGEEWNEVDLKEAQDLKESVQGSHQNGEDDEEGPMPLPQSNAGGANADQGNSSYGKALLPGEGQAIAQFVQQNLRIPRRGEIGYSGGDIDQFENSGYVMSGSRHTRMNAVRIRKENQVYSAEEQRALALITMEENQQKEAQLMEDFRTMLKDKKQKREKGST